MCPAVSSELDHDLISFFEHDLHANASHLSRTGHALISAKQLNLPHPEHLNSRSAARLNAATDPNPLIFEGLKHHTGSLENS